MPVEVQIMSVVMAGLAGSSAVWALVYFKLRKKELEMKGSKTKLGPEVDALRDDLNDTRAQVSDILERLDFTERMLAAGRAAQEDQK